MVPDGFLMVSDGFLLVPDAILDVPDGMRVLPSQGFPRYFSLYLPGSFIGLGRKSC